MVLDKDFSIVNTEYIMKRALAHGFTLIELLIVIAVLGILAVAVLSAINPIEQINRSRDTGSRSDAEQLLGAIDRFYATAGYYPWYTSADDDEVELAVTEVTTTTWLDNDTPQVAVLNKLSQAGTGELKGSFVTRIDDGGYNTMIVYNHGGTGESTYVCFEAKSSSFNTEAWLRCGEAVSGIGLPDDLQPAAASICIGDPATNKNFSCLP